MLNSTTFTMANSSTTSFNQTLLKPSWTFSPVQIVSLSVNVASILTASVNVVVFVNLRSKDQVYQFLLVSSIVELVYLIVGAYLSTMGPMCDASPLTCGSTAQYVNKINNVWLTGFFNSVLAFYCILNELFLSLQRLLILKKSMFMKSWKVWVVGPVMGIISALVYMPVLLVQSVKQTGSINFNGDIYPVYSVVYVPNTSTIVSMVQAFLRALLVIVGMTTLNVATLFNFRSFVNKKLKIGANNQRRVEQPNRSDVNARSQTNLEGPPSKTNGSQVVNTYERSGSGYRANRNITIMLLSTSALYIAGTMPYE